MIGTQKIELDFLKKSIDNCTDASQCHRGKWQKRYFGFAKIRHQMMYTEVHHLMGRQIVRISNCPVGTDI